ncbi:MAG: hypothetical protein WCI73_14700, partial [Phycisphaerae bacterium]
MSHNEMYVITPSAYEAAEGLANICDTFPDNQITVSVTGNIGNINFSYNAAGKSLRSNPTFQQFIASVKDRPHIECISAVIDFQGGPNRRVRVVFREQNDRGERMSNFKFENAEDPVIALAIVDGLHKYLKATTRAGVLAASLPQAERELIHYREEVVAKLEANVATIGNFALEQAKQQSQHINKLTS